VGAATGLKVSPGTLTLGGFFQYGHGSYDSVNSFTTGKVKGSGDTSSYGVGGLARLDFDSGYYLETSLRVGKVESDYKGSIVGIQAKYDIKAEYHGLHLGVGKFLQLSPANQLELYGRYAWTHQDGDTVKIDATHERLKLKAVDSVRARVGARIFHHLDKRFALYGGLSVEREFDGEADASTADGHQLDSPEMKGNSRIVELGLKIAPTQSLPWSTAVGVQAYGGKREGVTASAVFNYHF
ncbi:MAG: autotransporter outer membrane beta-barrel domain-containing protein, partial [Candidatus Accumulibacter sp.]|nr:autotransporter outer membrane beta-barrel domain-containing protein [Accumulibacter sp.]